MSESVFENWLIRNGKHKNTISGHLKNLKVINRSISNWSIENLDCFIISLKKQGRSNATLNHYIDTIHLYDRCMSLGLDFTGFKYFKKEQRIKGTFSDSECEAIINLPCNTRETQQYKQDTLFLKLLCYSGARPHEIAGLTKETVTDELFLIKSSKTGRVRNYPIPDFLKPEISEHVRLIKTNYLFLTKKGSVYNDASWWHMFKKRLKRAGIERKNVSILGFRHSMATSLLKQDVSPFKVAKLLGTSVKMLEENYSHLVVEDVKQALKQHPLIKKHTTPREILEQLKILIYSLELEKDKRFIFSLTDNNNSVSLNLRIDNESSLG